MICVATAKSPSAFSTHSFVRGFIQYLAFGKYLLRETVAPFEPPGNEFRRPHNQIQRKIRWNTLADFEGLPAPLAVERHDDEQIHIGIRRRPAVGVRAKQHNLVRVKLPRHRFTEGAYLCALDHGYMVNENGSR